MWNGKIITDAEVSKYRKIIEETDLSTADVFQLAIYRCASEILARELPARSALIGMKKCTK